MLCKFCPQVLRSYLGLRYCVNIVPGVSGRSMGSGALLGASNLPGALVGASAMGQVELTHKILSIPGQT